MSLETLWKYFENSPDPYVRTILCPLQQLPFQLLSSWAVSSCWFLLGSFCHETSVSLESSVSQGGGIQVHVLEFCHVLMFFHSLVHPWHFTDIPWLLPRMISWTNHGVKSWCISQLMFGTTALGQETWTEELTLVVALLHKGVCFGEDETWAGARQRSMENKTRMKDFGIFTVSPSTLLQFFVRD